MIKKLFVLQHRIRNLLAIGEIEFAAKLFEDAKKICRQLRA